MLKIGVALIVAAGIASGASAQVKVPQDQPLIIKSTAGADLFKFYCSSCHGLDGKGNRSTPATRTPPPDLTTLSQRNKGSFPRDHVEQVIRNGGESSNEAHTKGRMPVWGWIFRGLDSNDALVEIRIANLVQYIESIQEPRRSASN
jgi:mono/diheme cytochrome c family protein